MGCFSTGFNLSRKRRSKKITMANINVFPDELFVEILLRLPVKCLKRCSCVCKAWYSVISDPVFMAKHLGQTDFYEDGNARILICHRRPYCLSMLSSETLVDVLTRIRVPILEDCYHDLPVVLGPCNGIILLNSYYDGALLWNPKTREVKSLPRTSFSEIGFREEFLSQIAFGHDPRTDDYKLLRFQPCRDPKISDHCVQLNEHTFLGFESFPNTHSDRASCWRRAMEIYSLHSDSWRQMDLDVPDHIFTANTMNTHMKGRSHWLGDNGIVYFDMSDEVFGVIPLPESLRRRRGEITVYNEETIALIFYPVVLTVKEKFQDRCFDVWLMNEYGIKTSITRLYTIGPVSGVEKALGFWCNGGVFMESSNGELLLYDQFTQQFKNLGVSSKSVCPFIDICMQVIIYKESEVSLKGGRHEQEEGMVRESYSLADPKKCGSGGQIENLVRSNNYLNKFLYLQQQNSEWLWGNMFPCL